MNYHGLRRQIYRNELKQLFAAISQLGAVFVFFFINVLVSMFLYLSLYGISIIAKKETLMDERITYQAIYLMVIYALIKIQAKAILATPYRHFIDDLPIKPAQHFRSNLMLSAQAGNLVLFAPLALCFFMPDLNTVFETRFFVMFSIMVLLMSQTAIYRRNIPLFSMVMLPLVASYFYDPQQGPNILNTLWFTVVLLEMLFLDKIKLRLNRAKITSYGALLVQFVAHRPVNFLTRVLGSLAIIGAYSYVVSKRPDFATENFHLAISFPIALLMGSYQFEIERFRSQYGYYLADLPLSVFKQRVWELLPLFMLCVAPIVVYFTLVAFTPWVMALQMALIFLTAGAVVRLGKFYFLAPIGLMVVVIISLGFEGLGANV